MQSQARSWSWPSSVWQIFQHQIKSVELYRYFTATSPDDGNNTEAAEVRGIDWKTDYNRHRLNSQIDKNKPEAKNFD